MNARTTAVICATAFAVGFAAVKLGGGRTEPFRDEKNRSETAWAAEARKPKVHNILVIGHSWAEGTFRKEGKELEAEMNFLHGANVSFKVASWKGASIGDTRWQFDENFDGSVNSVVIFTGRNDWLKSDTNIVADLYELCATVAEKGKPVLIFNSQKVPQGTKDEEVINLKVELMNSTIEALCRKYGFVLLNVCDIDVGGMQDPYHPKSYAKVRELFFREFEGRFRWELSGLNEALPVSAADKTAVAPAKSIAKDE